MITQAQVRNRLRALRPFSLVRRKRLPVVPLLLLLVFSAMAALAEALMPHSPYDIFLSQQLIPPFWQQGGSPEHLLGTDQLGRDILSRIIMGARYSLIISVIALVLGGVVGLIIGIASGYQGGWLDKVMMRLVDSTLSFPLILLALVLIVALKPSISTVILAIVLIYWARFARVIRGEVLSIKERDFVNLARVAGVSPAKIMLVHIFPNIVNTWVVLLTLVVGEVIIVTASLSFLGAGIPPPAPAWGNMVAEGREYLNSAWWITFLPGLAIALTVLSFNLFGDWLRDTLDPRLRQV